jgi:hypothetical protein
VFLLWHGIFIEPVVLRPGETLRTYAARRLPEPARLLLRALHARDVVNRIAELPWQGRPEAEPECVAALATMTADLHRARDHAVRDDRDLAVDATGDAPRESWATRCSPAGRPGRGAFRAGVRTGAAAPADRSRPPEATNGPQGCLGGGLGGEGRFHRGGSDRSRGGCAGSLRRCGT